MLSFITSETIIHVILSVAFISIAFCFLFFSYGAYIEQKTFKDQSVYLARDLAREVRLLPQSVSRIIGEGLETPDLKAEDEALAKKNAYIKSRTLTVVPLICFIAVVIAWCLAQTKQVDFTYAVKKSLGITFFVLLTDIVFSTFFVKNLVMAEPDFVKGDVLYVLRNAIR